MQGDLEWILFEWHTAAEKRNLGEYSQFKGISQIVLSVSVREKFSHYRSAQNKTTLKSTFKIHSLLHVLKYGYFLQKIVSFPDNQKREKSSSSFNHNK